MTLDNDEIEDDEGIFDVVVVNKSENKSETPRTSMADIDRKESGKCVLNPCQYYFSEYSFGRNLERFCTH